MRVIREYARLPKRGIFRRIARRQGGWTGWNYWAEGKSRDGYKAIGVGSTARQAVNDYRRQRVPFRTALPPIHTYSKES